MVHAGFEYFSFLALLASLFLASSGIVVDLRARATPGINLGLLLGGAVLANLVGTTGASLLLIRPFLRINEGRLRPYHVAFFIMIVANIGGALTPIGDPPLFLGYLRGIDFFRFFTLALPEWLTALSLLGAAFWWFDSRNHAISRAEPHPRLTIEGGRGLFFLPVIIGAVFLDPAKIPSLPALTVMVHGEPVRFSFLRELIQLAAGYQAWRMASPHLLRINGFTFEPIREVAFLFAGIFATMAPALAIIHAHAVGGRIPLDATGFYFGTGGLSAVLDNAPTYLAFLSALEGKEALTTTQLARSTDPGIIAELAACTVAAVFWGAMTYIGNGPNFMVKAICSDAKDAAGEPLVETPSFFGYILRFSLPILLPVLIVVWAIWIW
jgi:Na+/H+ antiporter NhaD/arsenite permease-like protein